MTPKHFITTTLNDKEVYAYLIQSPLKERISQNPHLLTLVKEVVASSSPTKSSIIIEKDMGRTVGYSELLETKEGDAIFYARQVKTPTYTKFVKNRRTVSTTFLTIHLQQDGAGNYEVVNVWVGKDFPANPGEENAPESSKAFWENHAVVYNGQGIMASTVTKECPY